MTPQEAINILKDPNKQFKAKADGAYEYTDFVEAKKIAISALEKQIPKKPTKRNITIADETDYFTDEVISTKEVRVPVCPNCGNDPRAILNIPYPKRCLVCGQALDWQKLLNK